MGYYVTITEADFLLPADKLDEALAVWRELNTHDELKRGGSSSGEKWFSWMNMCEFKSAEEILENLGFNFEHPPEEGIRILGYDSKMGQEGLFLEAVAPLVKPGSYIKWRGEDGELWRQDFDGKIMTHTAATWNYGS